ncbi:AAA family ATPase [Nocardiopsis sp. CNT312]|uniref:AAA family ATPase n=1 Tax=Nocardiopsis sp. CNT312 TaxID=1137268 RepID=UPI0004BA1634|nr:AAA family ATPase [Nocardiopsis sp. CNT312]
MARRRLRSLTVEGLTSIRSATVELGDVNVLIGANGAGKSNFVSALAMLGRIADGDLGLFVGLNGGASGLLHQGPDRAAEIRLRAAIESDAQRNQCVSRDHGFTYKATLTEARDDRLIFSGEEIIRSTGSEHPLRVKGGHGESVLSEAAASAVPSSDAEALTAIADILRGCRVFHFHDTGLNAPMKRIGYAADNLTLHPDAGNLAALLMRLRESEPYAYRRILRDIRKGAPFLRDFVLVEQNEQLQLRWKQVDSDTVFPAGALSDGTLRFICLATLLGMPNPPGIIVLDEPELGLHPYAIVQLADMLRAAGTSSQIVIATQSTTLVDQFALDELVIVERERGPPNSAVRPPVPCVCGWTTTPWANCGRRTCSAAAPVPSEGDRAQAPHPLRGPDRGAAHRGHPQPVLHHP